jgi:hypothetical protein
MVEYAARNPYGTSGKRTIGYALVALDRKLDDG